jgi:nitroreductase
VDEGGHVFSMADPTRHQDLYQAILARRSVRRYDKELLSATTLATIRQIIVEARPLVPENRFEVTVRDDVVRRDLVALLGAYGRLITPPHALVPSMAGESHVLEDLGYRVEQIVVRMTALGIGTCYIGTLADEDKARATLGLTGQVRIGALVAFGRPAMAPGGRAINTLIRSALGRNVRPDLARFFFQETFDNPIDPPEHLLPLIEAAACAPSACNAQPWRLLWRDGWLTLFVTRNNPRYGEGAKERYCLYDAGIAMANISLAMESLGMLGQWQLLEAADPAIPAHPANLHPVATLDFGKA